MKSFLTLFLFVLCMSLAGQTPTYDDLTFDEEEIKAVYKPSGKSHVILKSKKGTEGMPKVAAADEIISAEITDIILVFSETTEDAASTREENNRERWENLILTYPQFFQFATNYKNVCQCSMGADAESLKPSQGFYIYYKASAPKAAAAAVPAVAAAVVVNDKKAPAKEVAKPETPQAKETKKTEEPVKEKKEVVADKKVVQKEEEPKEEDLNAVTEGPKETSAIEMASPPKKKPGYSKPRKSKDTKACRPPFYGTGDEDLHLFFKDNIMLSKKQRRQVKGDNCIVKLSLNFDGSIKKAMVNGANPALNELVSVAVKTMDSWNPAVKAGTTVKSEVKISVRYDKASKAIKPFEVMITPRPGPKCLECRSDSDIFGD